MAKSRLAVNNIKRCVPRPLPVIDLSKEELVSLFIYEEGRLYWRFRPLSDFPSYRTFVITNARTAGRVAGWVSQGYARLSYKGRRYAVHALIYAYHHGPHIGVVDHINGDSLDNRIENLRLTDYAGNARNRISSGLREAYLKGTSFNGTSWTAYINVNKKRVHLGSFPTQESARKAYESAAIEHYGEFAKIL